MQSGRSSGVALLRVPRLLCRHGARRGAHAERAARSRTSMGSCVDAVLVVIDPGKLRLAASEESTLEAR
jgi:hypothetical protein